MALGTGISGFSASLILPQILGLGPTEILIILLFVVIIILGPKRIPEMFHALGQSVGELKKGMKESEETEEKPGKKTAEEEEEKPKKKAMKKKKEEQEEEESE